MQPDGTHRLAYSKFHFDAMKSASPAAVHSARFEEMSTPPADAHVPHCKKNWYDSPETVVASVESTSHASFAGAVPVVALTRGRQFWGRATGVREPTTSMPASTNAINAQCGTARKCLGRRDLSPQVLASLNPGLRLGAPRWGGTNGT